MSSKLPSIIDIIKQYELKAEKTLGQNYLIDDNIAQKIVRSAGNIHSHDILEIGPGPGGLTRVLAESGARNLILIEKDSQFSEPLQKIVDLYPERVRLIFGDIMKIDPKPFLRPPVKVIANLPYNIGTQILINFLTNPNWPPYWQELILMFQTEVAERIIAKPKTKAFGRLSIISQIRTSAEIIFSIPSTVFLPQPKIDSSVVRIKVLTDDQNYTQISAVQKLTKQAFNHRRKMLRQTLKGFCPNIISVLEEMNIATTARPEELSVTQFRVLADKIFLK